MKRFFKFIAWIFIILFLIIIVLGVYLKIVTTIKPPVVGTAEIDSMIVVNGTKFIGDNWIRQNEYGLWEMYVEGEAYQRGVVMGMLSSELIRYQEEAFVAQIKKIVPSKFYFNFLRILIGFFNRNIDKHIPEEYLKEIYGISQSASSEFNKFGIPYMRMLNYHAAHDIGHALVNYALVGCTSFATWNSKTDDGRLVAARNFDFYFGDEFSKNKIVKFINPEQGYPFGFVTWGGMIGVVSGMNTEGLCVTISTAKSDIPTSSSTPVSIVARDILQYASNIEEAYSIAKKYEIFVSESFMITSAKDNMTAIIEKSPKKIDIFYPDTNFILCTNHFQSESFADDETNLLSIKENATYYRYLRLQELLEKKGALSIYDIAEVLRDRKGLEGKDIGLGNEKAINQLLAHHAIIFKPEEKKFFVSAHPNVMGVFVAYDLNNVFAGKSEKISFEKIQADTFLLTEKYFQYKEYKRLYEKINDAMNNDVIIPADTLLFFIAANPNYFETYKLAGDYFKLQGNCSKAINYYSKGLTKEINNFANRNAIEQKIKECKNQ